MRGRITKGTTVRGGPVNAGDIVDVGEDDYSKLLSTGDIEPVVEETPEPSSPKPKKKK